MFVFPGVRRALLLAYRWNIHLRKMNDGDPHPSAREKVLSCALALGRLGVLEMSITNSRLAFLGEAVSREHGTQLIVWNWITGENLLVRQLSLGDGTLLMWAVHLGTRYWVLPVYTVCRRLLGSVRSRARPI